MTLKFSFVNVSIAIAINLAHDNRAWHRFNRRFRQQSMPSLPAVIATSYVAILLATVLQEPPIIDIGMMAADAVCCSTMMIQ